MPFRNQIDLNDPVRVVQDFIILAHNTQYKINMLTMEQTISLLDHYCLHKSTKDTIVVFYYSLKRIESSPHYGSLLQFETKFDTYFAKKDLSKLDREIQEVLKHIRLTIQTLKSKPQIVSSSVYHNQELSGPLLTPQVSKVSTHRGVQRLKVSSRDAILQSSTFKVSQNIEQNQNLRGVQVEGSKSVVSHFGVTNPADQFLVLYNRMLTQYDNHRLDAANKTARDAQSVLGLIGSPSSVGYLQKIKEIQGEYNEMIQYYKEFDMPGWKFDNTSGDISLYSKTINEGRHVAVLITCELDIPMINLIVMIQELDLHQRFVPFCIGGEEIKRIQRNLVVGRSVVNFPFLTNREAYFYAKGINRLDTTQSMFFYSKSINTSAAIQAKYGVSVPKNSEYVRLQYNFFIMECRPISEGRTSIRLASSADIKLNFIPNFILMISARKFALEYFQRIMEQQPKFEESQWRKRLRQKREVYGFIEEAIQGYLHPR